ncbi:MAG: hypothetical protein ACI94Y_003983 [Maribacter sp.]|jgi:hypothetical protein
MASLSLQQLLFKELRKRIPKHSSLELELVRVLRKEFIEVLEIINYQTELSLNDAKKLADHFSISIDRLTQHQPGVVPFRFNALDYNLHSLRDYFYAILSELRNVDGWGPRRLIYAANDFPVFTLFQFPELAAFKLYFWGKTVYDLPLFRDRQFSLKEIDKMNLQLGERAWRQYLKMPSIEIWSSDIVSQVLKQVFHAWKFGFFKEKEDALLVCDQIILLLDHIHLQAEQGRKFHPNNYPPKQENYQLYYNEVSISNNTILFSTEDTDVAFILQNALNYLVTDNPAFCLKTEAWLHTMIEKSTLISIHNKSLRDNFFNSLKSNVSFVREKIEGKGLAK